MEVDKHFTTVAGWVVRRLGEHAQFLSHGAHTRAELLENGPVKNVHYGDIHSCATVRLNPNTLAGLPDAKTRHLDSLRDGDIVLADASEDTEGISKLVEICGLGATRAVAGQHTIAVRFDKAVLVDGFKGYLQFCPQFASHLRRHAAGTKVYAITRSHVASVEMLLPPPAEQQAIAEALADTDALLEGLDRLIAKKRDLKQAAMQQLLTGRTRLPGFSGEWETVEFGDVATIRNTKVMGRRAMPGTPCVELDSIGQGTGRLLGTTEAAPTAIKYTFRKGDVLFGRLRAYLRKFWLATFDGVCSTEIWPLIPSNERLVGTYLHSLVQTDAFVDAAGVAYGTHMPRSDWGVLRKLAVMLPPTPEQSAIAAVLSDMDAEIAALEARRDKTRLLKQAMMQELLTGRTRLV